MATKNIVPNNDSEGGIGTPSKFWLSAYLDGLNLGNAAASNLVFTPSTGDTVTFAAGTNGTLTITTVDTAAAAANVGFVVDGTFDIDAAGAVTIDGSAITIGGDSDVAIDIDSSTLDIDASGAITLDGVGLAVGSSGAASLITSGAASDIVVTTVHTAGMAFQLNANTNAASEVEINAGILDLNVTGVSTLNTTGLTITGPTLQLGNFTTGADDTGVDVRFFSATASEGILYDASEDELGLLLTTKLKFHDIGGGEEIFASANGHLEINAGTTLDITAPTIDVNGTMDVSGNATFASNIGIGGGALQSYHANVTSALALDDQSSIFTRSNQLIIANNFYYGASDAGLAIEDGKSSVIFYDRDQLRLVFAASVNAGQPSSLQEKLSVSETGLLTIKDDLIIKTGGTIGGASDPDLLTLAADALTVAGAIKQSGSTSLLTLQDSNSDSSGSTNIFEMTDYENNVLFKIAQIDSSLNAEINQVVNGSLTFKTNNTAALTLASTGAATFNSSVTATSATFNTGNVELLTNATSYQWSNAGNNVSMQGTSGAYKIYTGTSGYTLALTIASDQAATFSGNVTATGGYYYGQSTNSFVRLDNTIGSQIGFNNYGYSLYDSNGVSFYTAANATPTLKLNVSTGGDVTVSTGNLVIGTAGKGIDFSAETPSGSGTASAILDDYEEGTWTPGLVDTENQGASITSDTAGFYTKIGRMVHCSGQLIIDALQNVDTTVSISGFPFTNQNAQGAQSGGVVAAGSNLNITAGHSVTLQMLLNSTLAGLRVSDSAGGTTDMTHTEFSANGNITFSITYMTVT